jgi:uncharacterized membrane protein YraQ (UPF0718 family)
MVHAFVEALRDSLAALPWLIVIYLLFEYLESRYEGLLKRLVAHAQRLGPLAGALLGCLPQCGFSMVASALYCHRSISLGTLLAVYLSTSDEAVPVILAQPEKIEFLVPLLFAKVVIGMAAGFGIDALIPRQAAPLASSHETDCMCVQETHCCGHKHDDTKPFWRVLLVGQARHALQIFLFILLVSFALNLLVGYVGETKLSQVLLEGSFLQPLIAVIIGLIPNCAASVVITQVFLKDGISFGSAIAGLCSSAGLGLIVLMKEAPSYKEALKIIALLAGISFLAGLILNRLL